MRTVLSGVSAALLHVGTGAEDAYAPGIESSFDTSPVPAPRRRVLGRPLRRWRVPGHEWAAALGLALLALPMLLEEFRLRYAARRLDRRR